MTYLKTSVTLWQYYRDEPGLDNNNNSIDFRTNNNGVFSFKFKQKITGQTGNSNTKDFEIMVSLKYCEICLKLKWCKDCILVAGTTANRNPYFQITDTKRYVPVVTLSTQDIINLLKKL